MRPWKLHMRVLPQVGGEEGRLQLQRRMQVRSWCLSMCFVPQVAKEQALDVRLRQGGCALPMRERILHLQSLHLLSEVNDRTNNFLSKAPARIAWPIGLQSLPVQYSNFVV